MVWRMFHPCFRAVATTDRRVAKSWAASRVRKAGDFHFHLHHAQGLLGEVVGEGDAKSARKRRTSSLNLCSRMSRLCPGRRLSRPLLEACAEGAAACGDRKARA